MKNKIILGIFIIICTATNTTAAPISQNKIKLLIKKAAKNPNVDYQLLAGMDDGIQRGRGWCDKATIRKVIIHKIGKVGASSYRIFNSMEDNRKVFTNQSFDVTFSLQGSCKLSFPAYVGSPDIRKNGAKYSKIIQGRVPLRNKLLTATISRDSFYKNKWGASAPEVLNKNETLKQRKNYRIGLYKKIGKNRLCRDFNYSAMDKMDMRMDAPMCKVMSASSIKNDNRNHTDLQRLNSIEKELTQYINSYPGAENIISSQKQSVMKSAFRKIMWGKTPRERHRLFIQTMNKWKRRN